MSSINEAEGADSSLEIYYDIIPEKYVTVLEYKNASVEIDPDTGLYVPVVQDRLGNITAVVDAVVDFIDDSCPAKRLFPYSASIASRQF